MVSDGETRMMSPEFRNWLHRAHRAAQQQRMDELRRRQAEADIIDMVQHNGVWMMPNEVDQPTHRGSGDHVRRLGLL